MHIEERFAQYALVHLPIDLRPLTDRERAILPLLIEAAHAMDDAFWIQIYGDPTPLLRSTTDPDIQEYIRLNYGVSYRYFGVRFKPTPMRHLNQVRSRVE